MAMGSLMSRMVPWMPMTRSSGAHDFQGDPAVPAQVGGGGAVPQGGDQQGFLILGVNQGNGAGVGGAVGSHGAGHGDDAVGVLVEQRIRSMICSSPGFRATLTMSRSPTTRAMVFLLTW